MIGYGRIWGQDKLIQGVAPGNCIACHGEAAVLPKDHPETFNMIYNDCKVCHTNAQLQEGQPNALSGRISLGHIHTLGGIDCAGCHGTTLEPLLIGDCLACHGDYKAQANRLNTSLPKVHDSHMGDLACNLCHKAHARSVNFCSQCHDWNYLVP